MVPAQSVETALTAERQATREQGTEGTAAPASFCHIAPGLIDELWRDCDAAIYMPTRAEFEKIVLEIGMARNFGLETGLASEATPHQQAEFFAALRMADLVLARAAFSPYER